MPRRRWSYQLDRPAQQPCAVRVTTGGFEVESQFCIGTVRGLFIFGSSALFFLLSLAFDSCVFIRVMPTNVNSTKLQSVHVK
uniref:Uncharacterized protein n=1 Tax=Aegilops tauschii subsp. strangulata TaxID=200361 RepID=A0A453HGN9_AEGTS